MQKKNKSMYDPYLLFFLSVLPLNGLGKRDFPFIIILPFFRQITLFSCDTLHQTLQNNFLPTLPQQTPNNQSPQLLYFFFSSFLLFLKKEKNNIFLRQLSALFSF